MVLNPFKSAKWRHRSTTIEIKDEESPKPPPKTDSKTKQVPFNSDSVLNGIGDYIFQSPLGGGKFSKVMLATHYSNQNKVAIKIINKRAYMYRVMSRLVREIFLMEILHHENIVRIYETYETADALYLVMEYVEGYNLEEYLKKIDRGMIHENEAREIFRQVVKAVDHCHSKWIVHRDLKTPNILLTTDNHNVKLADFGLGNRFGLQRLKTVCGSMLYYSPEIITARSYFGPEVDTWCLGIMLFRMTAGLELFSHAKTSSELKKYILNRHYKFPAHLSQELQMTIQKCLSVDRYDRLSLNTILSNDPWFNNFGKLPNIFEERGPSNYKAHEATEAYVESIKSDDSNRIKYSAQHSKLQCKQDLQEEKKAGIKIQKTVIYHIFNPSTYYTGPAPHSSLNPIDLDGQSQVIMDLNQNLIVTLKQNKVQQVNLTDLKSPITHLFRKLKREPQLRKTSSALNLTQFYQRDHTSYYSIQCNIQTDSATTVISGFSTSSTFVSEKRSRQSKRLSHRLSMMFFSNTLPELNLSQQQTNQAQTKDENNPTEMIKIVRLICEILGITYYQTSNNQLECLLTLRNCKKKPQLVQQQSQHSSLYLSKKFTSSDRLSKQQSSIISNSSASSISNNWFSRQVHRLSAPFSNSQSNLLTTSSHELLSMGRLNQQGLQLELQQQQQQQQQQETEENEDSEGGFVILNIDAFNVPSTKLNSDGTPLQVVAVKYSKVKGSNKVFKLAKGWIQMLLSQNSHQQYEETFIKEHQQAMFNTADVIRL